MFSTLVLSFCILSCNSQSKSKETVSKNENSKAVPEVLTIDGKKYTRFKSTTVENQPSAKLAINFYPIRDPNNGMTVTTVPLPGKWQYLPGAEYNFIGPNGIKIMGFRTADYYYTEDQQQLYLYQTVGKRIAYPKTMDQIIKQNFMTEAAKYNRKLMKTYPLPEAAAFMKLFSDLQYKIDLTPKKFEAVGTEWEDPDGTSYMTIIVRQAEQGPEAKSWGISFDVVQSSKVNFAQAKRMLINYMVNQEINMDWIRKVNADLKTKIDESNRAHRQMMEEVKHNMDVFQKGQAERRAAREELDNDISNYILGKSDVVSPVAGTTAKVNAGSTYYWINEKGEYISTESYSWNPNDHEPYKKYSTWVRHQLK